MTGDGVGDFIVINEWVLLAPFVLVYSGASRTEIRMLPEPVEGLPKTLGWGATIGDQDGDGVAELALSTGAVTPRTWFVSAVTGEVLGSADGFPWLALPDMDDDGQPELFLGARHKRGDFLVRVLGSANLQPVLSFANDYSSQHVHRVGEFADVDGDGFPHLLVVRMASKRLITADPSRRLALRSRSSQVRAP